MAAPHKEDELRMETQVDDENASLSHVVFKLLDIPDEEEKEEEDDDHSRMDKSSLDGSQANGSRMSEVGDSDEDKEEEQHDKKKKRKKNEREMEAKVLISCGHKDVDPDVFRSIHDNGLVYNGRLIVNKNFETTD